MDKVKFHTSFVAGFTLVELMVSVFILTLLTTTVMFDLRASKRKDELNTAARVVAADLRSLQARALTGQNIQTCTPPSAKSVVCELSAAACGGAACLALPPFGVGVHFQTAATAYILFADVEATKNDWQQTDASEIFLTRDLASVGAPNVTLDALTLPAPSGVVTQVDVAFQRQNGSMVIGGCVTTGCSSRLEIRLKHTVSGDVKLVELNGLTGRISIP